MLRRKEQAKTWAEARNERLCCWAQCRSCYSYGQVLMYKKYKRMIMHVSLALQQIGLDFQCFPCLVPPSTSGAMQAEDSQDFLTAQTMLSCWWPRVSCQHPGMRHPKIQTLQGQPETHRNFQHEAENHTEPTSTSFPLTSFDKEGLSMAWNENKKIKDCKTKSTMTRKPKRILYRNMYASVIVFYWCALTWLPLRLHYDVKHRPMVPGLK